jgi:hypothetical protein
MITSAPTIHRANMRIGTQRGLSFMYDGTGGV